MKKLFFIALVFCGSVAAQGAQSVGWVYENKDKFTGTVSRIFTASNTQKARIMLSKSASNFVEVAIFAERGNLPDCRKLPLLVKDKNNKIHEIKMRDSHDACFGVAPSVLFEEQFSVRIYMVRGGYSDIDVDAKNFDASVLTE